MTADTAEALRSRPPRAGDLALAAYFRDASSFHETSRVAEVIRAVGEYDRDDDWDWGRCVYEWRRMTVRVRVCTASDAVVRIELLDPQLHGRFDPPVETLWQHPTAAGGY